MLTITLAAIIKGKVALLFSSAKDTVAAAMPEEFDAYRKWLGIPPEEQPPNHYRLLGIALFEDDPDVIENAANRQMAHVRTFQTGKHSRLSQQILNELAAAKVCLLNGAKKASYDAALHGEPEVVSQVEVVGSLEPPVVPPLPRSSAASPAPAAQGLVIEGGSPIVVASTPRAKRPAASRSARSRNRSHVGTILLLLGCAVAMAAAIAAVLNMDRLQKALGASSSKSGGDSKGGTRDTSTTPAPTEKPEKPSLKPGSKPPRPDDGFLPQPPVTTLTNAERELAFELAIEKTRQSMGEGSLESASRFLIEADSFKATEKEQSQVLHLRTLNGYLVEFWNDVRQGIYAVEPGKPFEFRREQYVLVRREGDLITYRAGENERSGHIRELEPRAAVAFAHQSPEFGKGRSLVRCGTFLAFDTRGGIKRRESQREFALHFWREAAKKGEQDPFLARELEISLEDAER